ncbi:antiviral reverse transcriptase Drt3a [Siccibacter turicensis]|uniref:antiviral reverse transcriptase Drt3a n=1 Tax=Siccibacter turicensis TaxID=357233 RepID=UPI0004BA9465|nr:antiviral reverse transcriptase Drt3a [Siccibacter turicensis]
MKRQPFTKYILEKNLLPREKFHLGSRLLIEKICNDAHLIAEENFRSGVQVNTFMLHGKSVYSTKCLKEKIILRHCSQNLNQALGLSLKQRNTIIDEIKTYLAEGTQYKIYRLDIKSFFESIDVSVLIGSIEENINISRHTRNLVEWYLKGCQLKHNNIGLPRGLEISPILSDIYLINFDEKLNSAKNVIYYSRFVDDIILITNGDENEGLFLQSINEILPTGLKLNNSVHKKSISPLIEKRKQGDAPNGTLLYSFDFLGYKIGITNTHVPAKGNAHKSVYRKVAIDFSDKRLKKFKTRISRAFYAYNNDTDFSLLHDRIKFLTSNRGIKRQLKGNGIIIKKSISTGIFYSNSKLDSHSVHLTQLDSFLYFCINNVNCRMNSKVRKKLTKEQKKQLLKNSFRSGFNKKIHINFNFNRCSEIIKIWQ